MAALTNVLENRQREVVPRSRVLAVACGGAAGKHDIASWRSLSVSDTPRRDAGKPVSRTMSRSQSTPQFESEIARIFAIRL